MKKFSKTFGKGLVSLFILAVSQITVKAQTATHLHFDGVNDYINLPVSSLFNFGTGDFSVEAWVKTSSGATQVIVGGSGSGDFWLGINTGKAAFSISGTPLTGSTIVNNNQWHHIAGVRQSGIIYIYVDGVLDGSLANGLSFTTAGQSLKLGNFNGIFNFAGEADEIRIWNAAQSAGNISARRNIELAGNETGLLAYYKFNQGTGGGNNTAITTAINSTANPLNGATTNFALNGSISNFLSGSAVPALANGLNFDGVNDYIDCGNNIGTNNLGLSGFTLEAWVNLSNTGIVNSIIRKTGDYNLYVNAGTLSVELWPNGIGNPSWRLLNGTTSIANNTWTHVAATWDGSNLNLYVNGLLNNGSTATNTIGGSENLIIGNSTIYNQPMAGSLDEVRIWNRPLCPGEIQNNMTGELNPALQSALQAYYRFNQGTAGSNNAGITTLSDVSGNSYTGTLNNFTLNGATSNWVAGTVAGTAALYSPATLAGIAGGAQTCLSTTIQSTGTTFIDASCNLVARLVPSGASPVTGTINTCVIIDASVQTYNTQPYVQRHYDIEPAANAATATGTVTLYFTQAEFDAFNAVRGTSPALPINGGDAIGIANLYVTQYHGTGTAPGNYTGSAVFINPDDNNIVWNNTLSRWEITFAVTGFSGFYVHTITGTLPLHLISFSGSKQSIGNVLQWHTNNESNAKEFTVERSDDGSSFGTIGNVAAKGIDNASYNFTDHKTFAGKVFYRLKMTDNNGKFTYSKVIRLINETADRLTVYPNPVTDKTTLQFSDKKLIGSMAKIIDMSGKMLQSFIIKNNYETVDLSGLSAGIYILQTVNGTALKLIKQ